MLIYPRITDFKNLRLKQKSIDMHYFASQETGF